MFHSKTRRFRVTQHVLVLALGVALLLLAPTRAWCMCCPVPCFDCWIESAGQLNLVVVDDEAGTIRLVPNIRIVGQAQDFALIVPTPTVPEFDLAPASVWSELVVLTAPGRTVEGAGRCGGNEVVLAAPDALGGEFDAGVGVIVETTVGAFDVTVLESDDPDALLTWLVEHGFPLDPADAALFAPYIERRWVFTTMQLDPERAPMPGGGWNTNVEPVAMTYRASEFELALPLMSVNRAARMPVSVYAVDRNRTTLAGFETLYANSISAPEYNAIAREHPGLAEFVAPYRWLTRLDRVFDDSDAMDASIHLERAPHNLEFRRIVRVRGALSYEMLFLVVGLAALRRRRAAARN